MPINWILGHKPITISHLPPKTIYQISDTYLPFRVIHSHSKARFGNKFQSDLLHKLSFLLLLLTYSYLSNEIIFMFNVYLHQLGRTHILNSNFMNHNQTTSQFLYIQYLSKLHFCGQAHNPSFS